MSDLHPLWHTVHSRHVGHYSDHDPGRASGEPSSRAKRRVGATRAGPGEQSIRSEQKFRQVWEGEQCGELQKQEWSLRERLRWGWQGRSPSTRLKHHQVRLPAPPRPQSMLFLPRRVRPARQPRRRVPPLQRQPPPCRPGRLPRAVRPQARPRSPLRRAVPSPMPRCRLLRLRHRRRLRRPRLRRFLRSRDSTKRGFNASRTAAPPGCKAMPTTPPL